MVKRSWTMLAVENLEYEICKKDKAVVKCCVRSTAVHFILDGEGFFNGERLQKGQGFITFADEFAYYYPDKNNPWTYLWFRVSGDDDEGVLERCSISKVNRTFSFDASFLIKEGQNLTRLCNLSMNNDVAKEAIAKWLISFCHTGKKEEICSLSKNVVDFAKRHIDDNYHKKISIQNVAKKAGIGRKYLCMLFVKELGLSPREYLTKKRIDRAKFLLARNDLNVSLVAFSVGYDDALGFSRIFKKHVGVSPKRYREKLVEK